MQLISNATSLLSYIDGGSASMLFQALIGGFLAFGYLLSNKISFIRAKLSRKSDVRH
jgi:hypothetical protein